MRSVLVSKFVPWPPNSGEKRRTLAVARALKALGPVTICAFVGEDDEAQPLIDEGFEVVAVPLERSIAKSIRGLAATRSLSGARFYDEALASAVSRATADRPDVLVIEHVQLRALAHQARARTVVVDMHNVESLLAERMSAKRSGPWKVAYAIEAKALRLLEARAKAFDLVLVASKQDGETLQQIGDMGADKIIVVPNAWDETNPLSPAADPVVSFVALLGWGPNIDAALWLAKEVWPLVLAEVPDAKLQLVGRAPSDEVREQASESIIVTGTVDDLEPWYAKTRVAVAPLLAGGGSRLKILEALSVARPLVSTTVGAEGLEDLIGRGVIIGDTPQAMADAIVGLLRDPERAHSLGLEGAAAVEADHSWTSAVRPFVERIS